jgi:hypothetical protein
LVKGTHQGLSPNISLRRIDHTDGGRGIQRGAVCGQDQQTVRSPLWGCPFPDITEEIPKYHSRL